METSVVKSTDQRFLRTLKGFHGTSQYHRHQQADGQFLLLTDGCEYVRQNAGDFACWLFNHILSFQRLLKKHRFQVWRLNKQEDNSWFLECQDGNEVFLVGKEIEFFEFPADHFELWVVDGVALLPTEY